MWKGGRGLTTTILDYMRKREAAAYMGSTTLAQRAARMPRSSPWPYRIPVVVRLGAAQLNWDSYPGRPANTGHAVGARLACKCLSPADS